MVDQVSPEQAEPKKPKYGEDLRIGGPIEKLPEDVTRQWLRTLVVQCALALQVLWPLK